MTFVLVAVLRVYPSTNRKALSGLEEVGAQETYRGPSHA
jgi:hypothetical protein